MDQGTKTEKFVIRCLNCQSNQRKSEVVLYVDWQKKYYMSTCVICHNMEAFDEFGHRIELKQEQPKLQVN